MDRIRSVKKKDILLSGAKLDIILLLALVVPYILLVSHFNFLTDDAFISFRYAKNVVEGLGLRYNPGESPPVEGFSNFLWVLVLSFFLKLGVDPTISSRVLSISCGLLLLGTVHLSCRTLFGLDRFQSFLGALSLALFPSYAVWSTGGLETIPYTLSLFLLLVTLLNTKNALNTFQAGFLGLILMLLRPEGIGFSVLIALLVMGYFHYTKKPGPWRNGMALYFIIMGLGQILLTLWRLIYFDSFLPNTFYAKVGFTSDQLIRGWYYVAHFFLTFPGTVLILLGTGMALLYRNNPNLLFPLSALAFMLTLIPLILGGDFMAMARFMVPITPVLSVLLAQALCPRWEDLRRPFGAFCLLVTLTAIGLNLLPAFDFHVTPSSWREAVHFQWNERDYLTEKNAWLKMKNNTERWTLLGKELARISTKNQTIVKGSIGALGYYSGIQIYDKFGLVSREIARGQTVRTRKSAGHDKSAEMSYFLKYRPDYIQTQLVSSKDLPLRKIQLTEYIRRLPEDVRPDYTVFTHPVPESFLGEKVALITLKFVGTRAGKSAAGIGSNL